MLKEDAEHMAKEMIAMLLAGGLASVHTDTEVS